MSATDTGAVAGSLPETLLTDGIQENNGSDAVMDVAPNPDDRQADASGYDSAAELLRKTETVNNISNKRRKSPSPNFPAEHDNAKRVRLDPDDSDLGPKTDAQVVREKKLPAEIWQHIFTFLPPKCLGRLLSVNKLFHFCLNPSPTTNTPHESSTDPCVLPFLKPDAIWQASRRFFWPRMPAPLRGKSELDMWRLVCSPSCQFCSVRGQPQSSVAGDPWKRGPGAKGVSPVFPFFVSSCGTCLAKKTIKEIDVLLSSTIPSVLLPALPILFLSEELGILPPQLMHSVASVSQSPFIKVFWPEHLDDIKSEFESVKVLGPAAAEEWLKGLEARGKQRLTDASRWEKWDLSGGVYQMQIATPWVLPLPDEADIPNQVENTVLSQPTAPKLPQLVQAENQSPLPQKNAIPGLPSNTLQLRTQGQQKRTKEEATELKAKRKAEIERRALLLDPPLTPDVLAHIPSFQAALQIIAPLDDSAWELLRPRILAQRQDAESRLEQSVASARAIQERSGTTNAETSSNAEPKKVTDADWDEIQGPLRGRISDYADELMNASWKKVTKKNCPQFAIEVLQYVRRRFYAEVAKDAAAAIAAGKKPIIDPPEGPWTQKLTLENMKWIFDFKIKPRTDKARCKELFLCNGCQESQKYYGFEAVIQHYAAKHTNALSVGSVVVHWRSEWPEVPPFRTTFGTFGTSETAQDVPPWYTQQPDDQPTNGSQPQHAYPNYTQNASHGYPSGSYGDHMPYFGYAQYPQYATTGSYAQAPHAAYGSQPYDYSSQHQPYSWAMANPNPGYPSQPPQSYSGYTTPTAHGFNHAMHSASRININDQNSLLFALYLDTLTKVALEAWNKVATVKDKDVPASIKVSVLIHHIAKKFQKEFSEAPPLDMFIYALATKEMIAIRNVNNTLACKACTTSSGGKVERSHYSLPQLAKHFRGAHSLALLAQGQPPMDWRIDMVQLPDMSVLRNLKNVVAYRSRAYGVLIDTLPWAFDGSLDEQATDEAGVFESNGANPNGASTDGRKENPLTRPKETESHPSGSANFSSQKPAPAPVPAVSNPPRVQPSHDPEPTSRGTPHLPQSYSVPSKLAPIAQPASAVYGQGKASDEAIPHQSPQRGHMEKPLHWTDSSRTRKTDVYGRDARMTDRYEAVPGYSNENYRRSRSPYVRHRSRSSHIRHRSRSPHVRQRSRSPHIRQRSRSPRIRQRSIFMEEPAFPEDIKRERRDSRDRQYSRDIPFDARGYRPAERLEHEEYSGRAAGGPAPRSPASHQEEARDLLGALESHLDRAQESIMYVDPSGRELRKTADGTFVYRDDPTTGPYRRPGSPRYDSYPQDRYRDRDPPSRNPPSYRDEYPREQAYFDPRSAPAEESYELVEVRDPQGDYFIKRPIQRDGRDHYRPESRPPPRELGTGPRYQEQTPPGPRGYHHPSHDPSMAPRHPPHDSDYEDYDPRYPAVGGNGRDAPRYSR